MAAWAAYRVTRASIGKSPRRKWRRDPGSAGGDGLGAAPFQGRARGPRHRPRSPGALGQFRRHPGGADDQLPVQYRAAKIAPQPRPMGGAGERRCASSPSGRRWPGYGSRPAPCSSARWLPCRPGHPVTKCRAGFGKPSPCAPPTVLNWRSFCSNRRPPAGADFCAARFAVTLAALERRAGLDLFGAPNPAAGDLRPALGC